MTTASLLRTVVPCALLALSAACTSSEVRPRGEWRIGGSSDALFESRDGGDFGDEVRYGAELSVGKLIGNGILVEVAADASGQDYDSETLGESESSETTALIGARYYFDTVSRVNPYLGARFGWRNIDLDSDITGIEAEDDAALWQLQLGVESFLTDNVALEAGVRFEQMYDVELSGEEDEVHTTSALLGLSFWF